MTTMNDLITSKEQDLNFEHNKFVIKLLYLSKESEVVGYRFIAKTKSELRNNCNNSIWLLIKWIENGIEKTAKISHQMRGQWLKITG